MPQKSKASVKAAPRALPKSAKKVAKAKPAKAKPVSAAVKPTAAKQQPQVAKAKAALVKEKAATQMAKPEAPKVKSKGKKFTLEIRANEAASALMQKWSALYKKAEQIDAKPYNMKAVFEEKTAITHKVLGWGYILANRNDRLEVLFKDGIKYLISNYKPG